MQNIDSIPISTDKRCYTVAELQKMLGISRGSVYQLLKTGQFHWFKIGTAIRISKFSFDEWLNGQSCLCQGCRSTVRHPNNVAIHQLKYSQVKLK